MDDEASVTTFQKWSHAYLCIDCILAVLVLCWRWKLEALFDNSLKVYGLTDSKLRLRAYVYAPRYQPLSDGVCGC